MKILALEFSSGQRSVAVVTATPGGIADVSEVVETGAEAMRALTMVDNALREAKLEREQIECVAVGLGPGSYTGIRAAIAMAQGWQLALGTKLAGISSADAIAAQVHAEGFIGTAGVVIDAQRDELYLASYDIGREGWQVKIPLRVAAPAEALALEQAGATLFGPDVTRWTTKGKVMYPRAGVIGRLAQAHTSFVDGEKLEPIYLRETAFVKTAGRTAQTG